MANLEGYYINLERSKERKRKIESHLKSLKEEESYTRFSAVKGDKSEAARRGLKEGELGLWVSWLQLLRRIYKKGTKKDFIHIIEDDARLSTSFFETLANINTVSGKFDILVTDMYVNPSIYKALSRQHNLLRKENKFAINVDIYTGCTSSILIPKAKIRLVYQQLKYIFDNEKQLLPIDNTLRRLSASKTLLIGRIAPFTTTVSFDDTQNSTIQEISKKEEAVIETQRFCTLLRKRLSIVEDDCRLEELVRTSINLSKIKNYDEHKAFVNDLYDIITKKANDHELLRYKYCANLIGEPDNPQS